MKNNGWAIKTLKGQLALFADTKRICLAGWEEALYLSGKNDDEVKRLRARRQCVKAHLKEGWEE